LPRGPLLIFAIVVGIIVYGSLYPFQFRIPPSPAGFLDVLRASLAQRQHRGDLVANVLLYVPFGLFLGLALQRPFGRMAAIAVAVVGGAALSTGIEFLQLYDANRVTSAYDIATNTAGTLLGALAAALPIAGRLLDPLQMHGRDPFAVLLALSWLGYRLMPFVPTLAWNLIKDHVKPLLATALPDGRDLLRHAVSWLLFGRLIEAVLASRHPAALLALAFAAVEVARVILSGARLTWAELAGGAIACALAFAPIWQGWTARALVAAAVAAAIAVEGLMPFAFQRTGATFHLLPFYGFLHGSLEVNVASLLQKFFLYGGLVWALGVLGVGRIASAVAVASYLLAIEIVQLRLPGRVSEITDPLIALIAAVVAAALAHGRRTTVGGAAYPAGASSTSRTPRSR
jgi:VanZ family protein